MPPRTNYFSGMRVSLFDATHSQIGPGTAIKNRISDLYNAGVVTGLTAYSSINNSGFATVALGTAYDPQGERIRVPTNQDPVGYNGAALNAEAANYTIVAQYVEGNDGTSGLDVDGNSNFRHTLDSFAITTLKTGIDTLGSNDVRLSGVETTVVGGTLIFDQNVRDTFSTKFGASLGLEENNLVVTGTLLVGGTVTFSSRINAASDIYIDGDIYYTTAGRGPIVKSPDGTKQAILGIDNSGFIAVDPLNYSI